MVAKGVLFLVFCIFFSQCFAQGNESLLSVRLVKSLFTDVTNCYFDTDSTKCLEERTIRNLHDWNDDMSRELFKSDNPSNSRSGKSIQSDSDEELQKLRAENFNIIREIQNRTSESRGFMDEVGNYISYISSKFLSPLLSESDDDADENVDINEKNAVEERGHKKKELKKKNKQLKIILLLMLFKNKIKMFLSKLQFLVQLKFLAVATVNMLTNLVRLWIELKKKHKPSKVVFYENAHHQHHYDHEHVYDDGGYRHPASYPHFHHDDDEEEYGGGGGGGPWPWSRSSKSDNQIYRNSSPYQYKPGTYNVAAYYHKRNLS